MKINYIVNKNPVPVDLKSLMEGLPVFTYAFTAPSRSMHLEIIGGERFLKVPLPNNNRMWSLEAFEWIKAFCTKYKSARIKHNGPNFDPKYIYIQYA